jgi:hypothetical protein
VNSPAVLPTAVVASAAELVGWVDVAVHDDAVFRGMELGPPAPAGVSSGG